MLTLDVGLVAAGLIVLAISAVAPLMEKWWCAGPMVAWLIGAAAGAVWFDAAAPDEAIVPSLTGPFVRITLALGLVGVALRLPTREFRRNWRPALVLLGPVMTATWAASTLIAKFTLGLDWAVAAVIGAIVTPTDPVLASSIVTGPLAEERLPAEVRNTISIESGLNDGLGLLFVSLAMTWLGGASAAATEHWLWHDVVWKVGASAVLGIALGLLVGWLLKKVWRGGEMQSTQHLAFGVALGLAVLGADGLLGLNGILGVFCAVAAMDFVLPEGDRGQTRDIQETIDLFFLLPAFAWLGATARWGDWIALGWGGAAFVALMLLARRVPAVVLFGRLSVRLRPLRRRLFVGWFGPMGVAAVFYAAETAGHGAPDVVWTAVTLAVAASVVVHGATASPLTCRYRAVD